jgi:diguanylate cyclase (GGDEF)-like protein
MPRLFQKAAPSGHKIMVIDDSEEVVESTRLLLDKDGHTIETALSGQAAVERWKTFRPHLMIVDYFMPGMTGEDVVNLIRPQDHEVQILLQTGYAGEKPPRDMLKRLDIQGYHDKSEGPEKLLVWVDAALKSYRQISMINKNRRGLRQILDAVPEMYNMNTLDDLLRGILTQMEALIGGDDSFVAALPDAIKSSAGDNHVSKTGTTDASLAVTVNDEEMLEIVAGTGRYNNLNNLDDDRDLLKTLREYLYQDGIHEIGSKTFIPMRVGKKALGILYFERKNEVEWDRELLHVFAMQASQALENRRLFGMATEDDLTKVFLKAFFFKRTVAEVQEAARYEYPISLCILDVDKFKTINDTQGHLVGDAVLREVSALIRNSVRGHDFVGRFGGDEFVICLPHTDNTTAIDVMERLRKRVEQLQFLNVDPELKVTLSTGVSTIARFSEDGKRPMVRRDAWVRVVEKMLDCADRALYQSKQAGRNAVKGFEPLTLATVLEELELARS